MKLSFGKILLVLCAPLVVTGCGDNSSEMHCPEKGEDFFKESVDKYFQKHPTSNGESYRVLDGATYEKVTNWWTVPVLVGTQKWNALLSCDGYLELSGHPR